MSSTASDHQPGELGPEDAPAARATGERTSVALYVCTHRRNPQLRVMLESVRAAADLAADRAAIALVIVDDNPDGRAREVAEEYDGAFELGTYYRHSGKQNISIARNLGLETAQPLAEWVAMLDDDVVVGERWFVEHLDLAERTGADATTGPVQLTFPHGPPWLADEPFALIGIQMADEDAQVGECQTGNSMVRSRFLADHPHIRFAEDLGVLGGEDMVFYHAATRAGLKAHFSTRIKVDEPEPPERSTFRYQMSRARWMGNTEFVTNHRSGRATRLRLGMRGSKRVLVGLSRPLRRMATGQRPQFRFAAAVVSEGLGLLAGFVGMKLDHR